MDKGNVDEVNYVDFTEDIDNEKQLFGVGRDFKNTQNVKSHNLRFTFDFENQNRMPINIPDRVEPTKDVIP